MEKLKIKYCIAAKQESWSESVSALVLEDSGAEVLGIWGLQP